MKIEIKATGIRQMAARMVSRRNKLADMTGPNKKAAVLIFQWVQKNFDAEGGLHEDRNLKWAPLAPSTIRRRRTGKPRTTGGAFRATLGVGPPKILDDTGKLRGRWSVTGTKIRGTVKSMQDYSGKHEYGLGNVPKRKIFPTPTQGAAIVFPIYQRHVKVTIR